MKLSEIVHSATVLLTFLVICLEAAPQRKWQPKDSNPSDTRSAEEWKRTHGMSVPDFEKMKQELKKCKKLLARTLDVRVSEAEIDEDDTEFMGDMLLTPHQIDECIKSLDKTETSGKGRHKRKSLPFNRLGYSVYKWGLTIGYQLEGTHSTAETDVIRQSIKHWEDETCIRFKELKPGDDLTQQYLFITRENSGCWSWIGKTITPIPQQLNLGGGCNTLLGIPVHEIGHAIGFYHEQSRTDRDEYVNIIFSNIIGGKEHNFAIATNIDNYSIPYDLSSVMHYEPYAFNIDATPTLTSKDPLHNQTFGQRIGLSFFDSKLFNKVYCNDICTTSLPCLRGGYPNPNDCNNCKCPDGFGGQYCEQVQQSDLTCNPYVNSPIEVGNDEQCVESPGYPSGGYSLGSSCNWLLKAPDDCSIDGYFDGSFTLPCGWNGACHQWVEIKHTMGLQLPGPRFCCTERPMATLRSQGSEMAVAFRSDTLTVRSGQNGFKFCFKLAPGCESITTTTTTSTSTSTTTTTATTTTTTTPTTTTTTTPTTTTTTTPTTTTTTTPTTTTTTTPTTTTTTTPTTTTTTTPTTTTTTTPTTTTTTSSTTPPPVGTNLCFVWSNSTGCVPLKVQPSRCGRSHQIRLCYMDVERTMCRWDRQWTPCQRKCQPCRREGRKTICDNCCELPEKTKIRKYRPRRCKRIPRWVKDFGVPYNIEELPEPTWILDIPAGADDYGDDYDYESD